MSKNKGVLSKTHTQKQLDDYANQHNPNNKAYVSRIANEKAFDKKEAKKATKRNRRQQQSLSKLGLNTNLDWYCYGNPFDFD